MSNCNTAFPFFGALSESEKNKAEKHCTVKKYQKGAVLYSSDSACLGLIKIIDGSVRVYMLSDEGREITLFRLEKGDVCALTASCVISQITFETSTVAETDCEILILDAPALKSLCESNLQARLFLYELTIEGFSSVMWSIQQILFAKLDRRLAVFLISESEKNGSLTIKMTHEKIAVHINSAREAVARMLARFVAEGFVTLERGKIIIQNPEALKEI